MALFYKQVFFFPSQEKDSSLLEENAMKFRKLLTNIDIKAHTSG